MTTRPSISVVTPTLNRAEDVAVLLTTLAQQTLLPTEIVLVDAADSTDDSTERVVRELRSSLPFSIRHIRHGGGTAVQRNVGINAAQGDFVAFIDDDIVLEPDFFQTVCHEFADPRHTSVAAIAGYITNQHLDVSTSPRWRMYRRLRLFTTYEPGRFDFATGYPINRYLQPPHNDMREVDCIGAGCAVWRRTPFDAGLRFAEFFSGYGVIEDAHLALSAKRLGFRIFECGRARCVHNHSPRGRSAKRLVARKTAVNYRFLFVDIVPRRSLRQELRFWRVQGVDLLRIAVAAVRHGGDNWAALLGKAEGIALATRVRPGATSPP